MQQQHQQQQISGLKFRSQLFFIYMSVDFYMVVFEKKIDE
jgi:hypothetical protein